MIKDSLNVMYHTKLERGRYIFLKYRVAISVEKI